MQKNKVNMNKILTTCALVFLLFFVVYMFIGILISGPVLKKEDEIAKAKQKIVEQYEKIENIERHVFTYVTYTGEDDRRYIIFDEAGKKIAVRYKEDAKFDEVKKLLKEEYPNLVDCEIKVGYGKNKPAYIIEKAYEKLVINFDNLRVVYYMKENA